jgi:hypothetical protein
MPCIATHNFRLWQGSWDPQNNNKLNGNKSTVGNNYFSSGNSRKEHVTLTRYRISHTSITYQFTLDAEQQQGTSWPLSYSSWIYYLCNQFLSPLWVHISIRAKCTTLCDKVCQWLATGRWFSPGTPPINRPPRYNWNIVESGVKHHQASNKQIYNHNNNASYVILCIL